MGQASWIAFQGISKEEALSRAELRDSGEIDETLASELMGAELPDGWFVVLSDDNMLAIEHNLQDLSSGCRVVAFEVTESASTIQAECCHDGEQIWHITYDGMSGPQDPAVTGSPPEGFVEIRDRRAREQQEAGPDAPVDYMFEIPIETAALAVCGYRYDELAYDWGQITYTRIERV